jgi:transposase InsO family protein
VGRIYQQTFIDTWAKVSFAKLYDRKTPLTAADLLNDWTLPFYGAARDPAVPGVDGPRDGVLWAGRASRIRAVPGGMENIDHTRTKARSPQTNGICEWFHKTVLNEFYRVAFRKKAVHDDRGAAGGPRRVAPRVQ